MFCMKCGAELVPGEKFCHNCGQKITTDSFNAPSENKPDKPKNKSVITIIIVAVVSALIGAAVVFFLTDKPTEPSVDNTTASVYDNNSSIDDYEHTTDAQEILTTTGADNEYEEVVTTEAITEPLTTTEQPSEPEYIEFTSDLQYNVNVFLSNFSESGLESFYDRPSDENLARFSKWYNFMNRHLTTVEWDEEDADFPYDMASSGFNFRISEDYGIEAVEKFFGIKLEKGFGKGFENYKDGYFYDQFTGASYSQGFTIVSSLKNKGDGIYDAEFVIYETSDGIDSPYYSYTSEQIRNDMSTPGNYYISSSGYGTARFKATDINDRSTYKLIGYDVTRTR
ncbi:MAG: zinc ribbon domain-containing protein [Clostridia bacterium]|nr:zinc ribbon domain-containing protein [Clostridia bacterium]